MSILIIDSREVQLQSILRGKNVPHQAGQLRCGDVLLQMDSKKICIERKTIQDFWSSIKDGRFREQRARLTDWSSESRDHYVIYLIEGSITDQILLSAAHRLFLVYKFHVWIAETIQESATYICWLYHQANLFHERTQEHDKMEDLSKSMKCKKEFQTSRNILIALIQSLHGCSYEMALAIAGTFGSVFEFVQFCADKGVDHFKDSTYETRSKNPRRIGADRIKKIFHLLGIPSSVCDKN